MPNDIKISTILVGALIPLGIAGGLGRILSLSRNSTEWMAGILLVVYFVVVMAVNGDETKTRNKSGEPKPE